MKKKASSKIPFTRVLAVFVPIILVFSAFVIYFVSKGYRINFSNGEIEKTGILTFKTIPKKASLYLDDEYVGKSPKAVPGVEEGTHNIKITKDGYYNWTLNVKVEAEQSIPVEPVLYLKKPQIERIFPSKKSSKTQIDKLFFDPDNQLAVFTVLNKTGETVETIEVWTYKINRQFWEFQTDPEQIAEVEIDSTFLEYDIQISQNTQNSLLSISYEAETQYYWLENDSQNETPEELVRLERYDDITPVWAQDSEYIMYTTNNELRSLNPATGAQSIVLEKEPEEKFIWTTDTEGFVYFLEETDKYYSVSRVRTSGENKTLVIDEIDKSVTRELSNTNNNTSEEVEQTNTTGKITDIQITEDRKYLLLFSKEDILIYSFDKSKTEHIKAQDPKFIRTSPTNDKFLYTDKTGSQLMLYTLKIEEGDPIHETGTSLITELNDSYKYDNFRWYPQMQDILFSRTEKSDNQTNSTDGNESENDTDVQENENIFTYIYAISPENNQEFLLFDGSTSNFFASGNSGRYIVTLCEGEILCKITIHD